MKRNRQAKIGSDNNTFRLGHSTIVLTLDTYWYVLPSMQEDATNQIEEILFMKKKAR